MSQYPVMQLFYKTSTGQIIRLGERVLVVDGGIDPLGIVYHIEDSSSGKTVKVVLVNEVRNLLNAFATNQRQPPIKSGKAGYYNIDDYQGHGLVYISIEGADDEGIRAAYVRLKEWHDEHGSTGGSGDSSVSVDPGTIPYPEWQSSGGKPGATGETVVVDGQGKPVEHPGKGEGEITGAPDDRTEYHEADTNRDGFIDRDEKKAWNKKNPDNPVEKGKA